MNHKSLLSFLLIFLFFSCTPGPEEQALELVEKSIEAHQLTKKWEDVTSIKFKKLTRVLDENGGVESELEQWIEFRMKPYFEAKLTWTKESISHIVNFNGSRMSYQMGENSIQNEGFLKAKKAEIDAAFFAFAQPWNLLDENANFTYEGQKTLEEGKLVESIRVDYGPDSDVWWFYFDPTSSRLIANELHAKDHKSLFENLSYEETTGIILAKDRKSYRIDEKGKKLFLRAEYVYSDYQVTFK